jgi:hypothetical protein
VCAVHAAALLCAAIQCGDLALVCWRACIPHNEQWACPLYQRKCCHLCLHTSFKRVACSHGARAVQQTCPGMHVGPASSGIPCCCCPNCPCCHQHKLLCLMFLFCPQAPPAHLAHLGPLAHQAHLAQQVYKRLA